MSDDHPPRRHDDDARIAMREAIAVIDATIDDAIRLSDDQAARQLARLRARIVLRWGLSDLYLE